MGLTKKIDWLIWLQSYTEVTSKLPIISKKKKNQVLCTVTEFALIMRFLIDEIQKSDIKFINLNTLWTLFFVVAAIVIAKPNSHAIYLFISCLEW